MLIGSLKAQSLFRVTLDGNKVVHKETLISDLAQIRDIEIGYDGSIYLPLENNAGGRIVHMTPKLWIKPLRQKIMIYYAVATVSIKDDSWVEGYLPAVTTLVEKHGGKYLARTMTMEKLEGDQTLPNVFVMIEFPSKEAALAFYNDPEYGPHLANRMAGSNTEFTLVAGEDMASG